MVQTFWLLLAVLAFLITLLMLLDSSRDARFYRRDARKWYEKYCRCLDVAGGPSEFDIVGAQERIISLERESDAMRTDLETGCLLIESQKATIVRLINENKSLQQAARNYAAAHKRK